MIALHTIVHLALLMLSLVTKMLEHGTLLICIPRSLGMHHVVAFCDAPEVAVICTRWWRSGEDGGQGDVRWPPCRTDAAKNRLLERNAAPETSWNVHPVRTLFVTGESNMSN